VKEERSTASLITESGSMSSRTRSTRKTLADHGGGGARAHRQAKMEWDLAWFDRYVLGKGRK
jgi:hypothetical protein